MSLSVSNNVNVNKPNYVAKGAAIALGADIVSRALGVGIGIKTFGKDIFVSNAKNLVEVMGKGKVAALVASGTALRVAIGAGIGKLVENAKAKKAEKAE